MDEIVETYRLIPTEGEGLLRNSHLEMLYATVRHFNGGISLKEQYGKDALIEIEEYRKELVEEDIADIRANEILLMDWKTVVKKFEEKFGKKRRKTCIFNYRTRCLRAATSENSSYLLNSTSGVRTRAR